MDSQIVVSATEKNEAEKGNRRHETRKWGCSFKESSQEASLGTIQQRCARGEMFMEMQMKE